MIEPYFAAQARILPFLWACAVLIAGCAAPTKTISFDSEPRGARVFLAYGHNEKKAESVKGRNFLGTTPFQWTVETEFDGTFQFRGTPVPFYSNFVQPVLVFTAEPPSGSTNLVPQRQIFHTNSGIERGAPVPEGVFFDFTKTPETSERSK